MKKNFDWKMTTTSMAAIVFYAICGVLLLVLPNAALAIANYAIAAVLAIAGVVCIINYLKESVIAAAMGARMALGLALICFAILMFCYPTFLSELLPAIWGLSLLVGGFGKVQAAFDLKRIGEGRWWLMLIGAVVSFVLGFMCLSNPVYIAQTIFVFIGICLLVEAVTDLVAYIVIRSRIRKYRKAVDDAARTVEI